jgi:hypothetical protein
MIVRSHVCQPQDCRGADRVILVLSQPFYKTITCRSPGGPAHPVGTWGMAPLEPAAPLSTDCSSTGGGRATSAPAA